MKAELVNEMFSLIEAHVKSRPLLVEFEMAYLRVVIDRIRVAIKATDQFGCHPQQLQEAGLQLLDALDRPGVSRSEVSGALSTRVRR